MSESIENILYIGHNIQLVKTMLDLSASTSAQSDACIYNLSCVDELQAALGERKYTHLICDLTINKYITDKIAIDFPLLKTTYLSPADSAHTELNKANSLLEQQRIRLAVIANNSPDLIFAKDLEGRILGCNKQFEKFAGCSEKEIIGNKTHHFFPSDQVKIGIAKDKYVIENNKVYLGEELLTHHNGKHHFIEMKKVPLCDNKGNVFGVVAIGRDITAYNQMQKRLKIADAAFENSKENLLVSDEKGNIIAVNRSSCGTSGFSKCELLGSHISIFNANQRENIEAALQDNNSWQGEVTYRLKNGDIHFSWAEVYLVEHEEGGIYSRIYSLIDLEKSNNYEEKTRFLSNNDSLTGLFNRIALFTRLESTIARAAFKQAAMAVILVDINGFKALNKKYGYNSGNALLKKIAERLKRCVFAKDTVARLGGDVFAILVDELSNELDVAIVAQKIAMQFEPLFVIEDLEISLSAAIGISLCPDDGTDVDTLIGNAEKALQCGKKSTNDAQFHFYTEQLTHHALQQFELEDKLKQALQQDQFELYYQPQYDLNTRQIVAMESLLYWNHPQQGLREPESFLSLAENSGLLVPIGLKMIRKAALQAVSWQQSKVNFGRIALNLLEEQLSKISLIADLQTILLETKCASQWLEFEIDEAIFASDRGQVLENLLNIHKLGIALTISNYADDRPALYLINQLGLNKLKLAKHYMKGNSAHFVGPAVANALATLGRSFGLDVVGESPENSSDESLSSSDNIYLGADRKHNKVMKASEATFYLRCNKRK